MRKRGLKFGLAATALAVAVPLVAVQPAYADYAPSKGDIVGVGSDTVQVLMNFVADGDAYGNDGYNFGGNSNKLISFDATADANVRLAFGDQGASPASGLCGPGQGGSIGTVNTTNGGSDSNNPCVLNPTIVLRANTQAVNRPNGSGAGFKALAADVLAGNNFPSGKNEEVVNFSRASSVQKPPATLGIDSVEVGTDTIPTLASQPDAATLSTALSTASATTSLPVNALSAAVPAGTVTLSSVASETAGGIHTQAFTTTGAAAGAVSIPVTSVTPNFAYPAGTPMADGSGIPTSSPTGLSQSQLQFIYSQNACFTWSAVPGLSTTGSTTADVIPILPQVGSGTRSAFLTDIQVGGSGQPALGTNPCMQIAEENDPTAIYNVLNPNTNSVDPGDVIEPISQARLNLFLGTTNAGGFVPPHTGSQGYFVDPSVPYLDGTSASSAGTTAGNGGSISRQFTALATSENGVSITALGGTLNVTSTTGFANPSGSVQVVTSNGVAVLKYTGTTATSFTGVTVFSTAGAVTTGNLVAGTQVSQSTNTYFPQSVAPAVATLTGTPASGQGALFDPERPLFVYFRDSDIFSNANWQTGLSGNWVQSLFYDPCLSGMVGCISGPAVQDPGGPAPGTIANYYGPDGAPFIDSAGAQLLQDAGVVPVDTDGNWVGVPAGNGDTGGTNVLAFTPGGA